MKLFTFYLAIGISLASASKSYSQRALLTLNMQNKTVREVFDAIEQQSEFVFLYYSSAVEEKRKIDIKVKNQTIDKVLDIVFDKTENVYTIDERQIYIARVEQPAAPQQSRKVVKGKIVDSNGDAVPGATVQVVGSTRGVMADENGAFEIDNIVEGTKLSISYIGMETKEIVFQGKDDLLVVLAEKTNELDEVTIVAFGKQKKESVLASITTVKPSELKVPSSNLTTAFAGRVAGLISYQQSGEPGQDNASFFIRGITSFGADAKKDPLILIDGMELSNDDLARLNTDDIASFSIMKDATAAALYGARGANGVILVTTKEGREGKAQVNVRVENSFSSPTRRIAIADPVTFMRMHNESVITRNPDGVALYGSEKMTLTERGLNPDIYPATDWYKTMFDDVTINQRANLSISGGGAIARYYVAANITQDNGNLKVDKRNNFNSNIDLTKYAVRSNVNINLSKTTELVLRLSSSFDEYIGPMLGGTDMYNKVIQANPVLFKPYYEPDEQYSYIKHIAFGNTDGANYINPYAEALKGYKDYSKNTTLTQFEVKQKLDMVLQGLSVRAMVNMNRYSEFTVTRQYIPYYYNLATFDILDNSYTLRRLNTDGRETIDFWPGQRTTNTTFYLESAAEYNRDFNEKHHLNALFVYIMQQRKEGLASSLQLSLPNRNMGLSGRMAYNYDSRYFAEFNFGYNGSERFALAKRWGFFPSIGAAWMLSNEDFFESLKEVVSQFKLKGTYGMVGNDA
ncbi:MAG: SusC/RagA family TonB-linked outer membrane protein, partial [Tannerella sp.]|nr:SusC/RagA family TonB-linked outer membrane protein [Tannerella sp.]